LVFRRPKKQPTGLHRTGTFGRPSVLKLQNGNRWGNAMLFRLRLWIRSKFGLRKRTAPSSRLPYELDEFAKLISSRDPDALKQLAVGLAGPAQIRPPKLKA
jgi:hypothetical protein